MSAAVTEITPGDDVMSPKIFQMEGESKGYLLMNGASGG
jgi:hypothetical protein